MGVVGLGYVGLATALGLASLGYRVYGLENDSERREMLLQGHMPFREPGMQEMLTEMKDSRFRVVEGITDLPDKPEVIFFCVGTPEARDGSTDSRILKEAIGQVMEGLASDGPVPLVIRSTIPPGLVEEELYPLLDRFPGWERDYLISNPEFLRENSALEDFLNPDRIVLGGEEESIPEVVEALYQPLKAPIFRVSHRSASFIKMASNSLLATLISFSNEMAALAESLGDIRIAEAFQILRKDRRWREAPMASYLHPGCGYGGYCLPKDIRALRRAGEAAGQSMSLIRTVDGINEGRPGELVRRVLKRLEPGNAVGILGLSFKPESADVRNTPAAGVIRGLREAGCHRILAYDPLAREEFEKKYPGLVSGYRNSLKEMEMECDLLVIVTGWEEFRGLAGKSRIPVVDGRYMGEDR